VTDDQGRQLPGGVLSWGRDCCVGVGSNETAAAGFRLRCGAERLLTNDRTDEEQASMRGLSCLPSTIRHTSCPVGG
jgi:hypothetical protein